METFLGFALIGLIVGTVYGLIALGFTLIIKATGIFNIAHGQLVTIGAYIYYALSVQLGIPTYLAFVLALLLCFVVGGLFHITLFRPLIGQPIFASVIVTLGLFVLVEGLIRLIWGVSPHRLNLPFTLPPIYVLNVAISVDYLIGLGITFLLFIGLAIFFKFSKSGLLMRAVADSQEAALTLGININRMHATAWGLGTVVAAAGGIAIVHILSLAPDISLIGLKAFPAVLLGGIESLPGALVGGIAIGVTENIVGGYSEVVLSGFKELTPYIILLIILLVKPYGIWGLKRIERV